MVRRVPFSTAAWLISLDGTCKLMPPSEQECMEIPAPGLSLDLVLAGGLNPGIRRDKARPHFRRRSRGAQRQLSFPAKHLRFNAVVRSRAPDGTSYKGQPADRRTPDRYALIE